MSTTLRCRKYGLIDGWNQSASRFRISLRRSWDIKHQKQLMDTKIIFGARPFCQWWYVTNYAGYGQRQDIYSPGRSQCMNEGVTRIAYEERDESGNVQHRDEWRCEQHRNNTTLHEVKNMVISAQAYVILIVHFWIIISVTALSTAEEVKKEMKMSQEDIAKRKQEEKDLGALMVIESQLIQQFNHRRGRESRRQTNAS